MRIFADTHVHWYSTYESTVFLRSAFKHLEAYTGRTAGMGYDSQRAYLVLCLAERVGSVPFTAIREQTVSAPGYWIEPVPDPNASVVHSENGRSLVVVAGRQVVTEEGLEVLALGVNQPIEDGMPLANTLAAVRAVGGFPVIAWAPGKWWFRRGDVLRRALEHAAPHDFALGDSSLRPIGWREPILMRSARQRGFNILHGSDPLPPPAEAAQVGRYLSDFDDMPFDVSQPAASLCAALRAGRTARAVGRRGGLLETFRRLHAHAAGKRRMR